MTARRSEVRLRYVTTAIPALWLLSNLLRPHWRIELPSGHVQRPQDWFWSPPDFPGVPVSSTTIDWATTLMEIGGPAVALALWWWFSGRLLALQGTDRTIVAGSARV